LAQIPSVLNRADFISILLPGYVTIISYFVVFRPTILQGSASFDIFSSIVFVVAGPSLGLTLQLFQRGLYSVCLKLNTKKKADYKKFVERYASARVTMNSEARIELDQVEALYDFATNTCLGLLGLLVLGWYELGFLRIELWSIAVIAIILFLGGQWQRTWRYSPLVKFLTSKYDKDTTPTVQQEDSD
jgi:hypothetical protein